MPYVLSMSVPVLHYPYHKNFVPLSKLNLKGQDFSSYSNGKNKTELCGDTQLADSWKDAIRQAVSSQDSL